MLRGDGGAAGSASRRRAAKIELLLVTGLSVTLPIRALLPVHAFSLGELLMILLLPVVARSLVGHHFRLSLVVALCASSMSGFFLNMIHLQLADRIVEVHSANRLSLLPLAAALSFIGLNWAIDKVGYRHVVYSYTAGLLIEFVLLKGWESINPWKYSLVWPITVLLLLTAQKISRGIELTSLVALLTISAATNSRNALLSQTVALLAYIWGYGSMRKIQGNLPWQHRILRVVALASVVYMATFAAAAQGLLGGSAQERIATGHNALDILDSSRTEWRASMYILGHNLTGIGPSASLTRDEYSGAIAALRQSGLDPLGKNYGYAQNYMFASGVHLHSVIADSWAYFGVAGLVSAGILFLSIGGNLFKVPALRINQRTLGTYLAVGALWDCLFSPMTSNLFQVVASAAILDALVRGQRVVMASHEQMAGRVAVT